MIRNPYVAGYFYPGSASELRATIAKYVDKDAPKEEVVGLLVPHAGYQYSGPVTGATISRVKFKDTFIIMGPSHSGLGKPFSVMPEGTWKTPLGNVEVDSELARKIIAVSKYLRGRLPGAPGGARRRGTASLFAVFQAGCAYRAHYPRSCRGCHL